MSPTEGSPREGGYTSPRGAAVLWLPASPELGVTEFKSFARLLERNGILTMFIFALFIIGEVKHLSTFIDLLNCMFVLLKNLTC